MLQRLSRSFSSSTLQILNTLTINFLSEGVLSEEQDVQSND